MKKANFVFAYLALFLVVSVASGQAAGKSDNLQAAPDTLSVVDSKEADNFGSSKKYVPVEKYDPSRNADRDIQEALAEAKRSNRRVLLEVGGLWCVWCRHMDDFFEKQQQVLALREQYFVTLKVNYSDENKNEVVLSRYPKIAGFPHIFVLDNDGNILHSQDTGDLEEGKGYNVDKFTEFLKQWADGSAEPGGK